MRAPIVLAPRFLGFPVPGAALSERMAMRTGLPCCSAAALAVLLLSTAPGIAQDEPPRFARPSVEELAVQPQKPAERESDTRESICLMIESAARESNLPLEFFAR